MTQAKGPGDFPSLISGRPFHGRGRDHGGWYGDPEEHADAARQRYRQKL